MILPRAKLAPCAPYHWLFRLVRPLSCPNCGHFVTVSMWRQRIDTDVLGSVADRPTVDRAFGRGIDTEIRAGALHKPDIVRLPKRALIDVNITGTLNLYRSREGGEHDRFVFTSITGRIRWRGFR